MNYGMLIGMAIGAVLLYLFKKPKPNVDADKALQENQALVDKAISDLNQGIANIKKTQRDPKEEETYYNKDQK